MTELKNLYDLINFYSNNSDNISPYNIYNVLITENDIKKLLSKYNITIDIKNDNINYYIISLTHKSYIKKEYYDNYNIQISKENNNHSNVLELLDQSNERLEFLGDTVIKCIISGYLFQRYYYEDEGFMTRIKTKIENRETLAYFAKNLGIDKFMIISKQIEENFGRESDKLLEDCFEAFMGALYLDAGFDICRKILINFLEGEIDFAEILYNDNNYKDQLLRYYHKNKWSYPVYSDMKAEGPLHCRLYTIGVKDNKGSIVGIGVDHSKRKAEQIASKKALIYFGVIVEDNKEIEDIKGFD